MHNRKLDASLTSIILLLYFYSFGTLGFLNLFNAKAIIQMIAFSLIIISLYKINIKISIDKLLSATIFLTFFSVGVILNGESYLEIANIISIVILIYYVSIIDGKKIINFSNILLITTTLLYLLILISFITYLVFPEELAKANFNIYDSSTGSGRVYPHNLIDWLSFTSGDGYEILGYSIPRLKGYSVEPSATVVHYLAPLAVILFLNRSFNGLVISLLIINLITISSLLSVFIITFSIFLWIVPTFLKRYIYVFIFLIISVPLFFSENIVKPLFTHFANFLFDCCNYDLFLRKLANEGEQSNLSHRISGMILAYQLTISSPFGYSKTLLGPGSPLIAFVSCYAGWVGVFCLGAYFYKVIKMYRALCVYDGHWFPQHFLFSLVCTSLFFSGYGWDRTSGILMLIIFYKLLHERTFSLKIS